MVQYKLNHCRRPINQSLFLQGFTLLEVLVALAVVAIALSAIIKITADYTENVRYLRDKTFASWIASNVMTEIQLSGKPFAEKQGKTVMAQQIWHWQATIQNTADENLQRVTIQVKLVPAYNKPLVNLTGFIEVNKNK